ncbi:hypothetical protein OKW21_006402 [Catalinimonas alkaloidigena]|uniref:hypothetical protein n=1 Tax=Catalinimonas alkaloidigena TaxID=1075417 RepID=UPI0024071517|nr:hypothetical protein [Catalinimonas alkaloidigena]MDF9801139.1 hypothetical protein [Catalinimonas alkaloidigena]
MKNEKPDTQVLRSVVHIHYLIILLGIIGCSRKKTEVAWQQSFYQIGSQSSPKAADLNADGILDIVIGAGKEELAPTEQGILALNGKNGDLLWQQAADASIVGSAVFYDINGDGVKDVFIGGRNHSLKALDGKSGDLIWEYSYHHENDPVLQYARFNFYNSVLVPDQNHDGFQDLLTVNGGNWNALPNDTSERHPAVLMLFDSRNGKIIAADTMPDSHESYMSPLCFAHAGNENIQLIFGTGGETMGGSLYLATLDDLIKGQLYKAKAIATEEQHGFIAPPVLTDITEDGYTDIIAISHAGTASAIDGKSLEPIWETKFSQMESSNSFAVGYFNEDNIPDFFTMLSKGKWPDYSTASQVLLDGRDGVIIYQNNIGCFNLSTPVAYDIDNDGYDEAILSVNDYDCDIELTEDIRSPKSIRMRLIALDFQDRKEHIIDQAPSFKNIYSTPWLGDLDMDGFLDIVYTQYFNPNDLFRFMGMSVKRISTGIRMQGSPRWGEYMGTQSKSQFPTKKQYSLIE